jgi:hypothetical protein
MPTYDLGTIPPSQLMNDLFHHNSDFKNLFDFELLVWALRKAGFATVERVTEKDLLTRFPEFPERGDDLQTLYVVARSQSSP